MLQRPIETISSNFWLAYLDAKPRFSFGEEFYYAGKDIGERRSNNKSKYTFVQCKVHGFFNVQINVLDIAATCISESRFCFDEPYDLSGMNKPTTKHLAGTAPASKAKQPNPRGRPPHSRHAAAEAILAIFSSTIPDNATHESILVAVNEWLKEAGRTMVSLPTVRRALQVLKAEGKITNAQN